MWKCPSCSYKTTSYSAMMKHYYAKHYKPKGGGSQPKGKQKKVYTFHPPRRK